MKNLVIRYLPVFLILAFELIGCTPYIEENTLPLVITKEVQKSTFDMSYKCWSGGIIVSKGGSEITESGICWSTHPLPTILDDHVKCSSKEHDIYLKPLPNLCDQDFICYIFPFRYRTRYYLRAYAKNREGVGYGNEVSFTTLCTPISISLLPQTLTLISPPNGATGQPVDLPLKWSFTSLSYDVYFGTSPNPTEKIATDRISDTLKIKDLDVGTTYYWKVKVWDTLGLCPVDSTPVWHFTTVESVNPPSVSTQTDSVFTSTGVIIGGRINSDGGARVIERGIYWGTEPNPEITGTRTQIGSGSGDFYTTLTGLSPNTKYYKKAYAVNKSGTGYGAQVTFYTGPAIANNTISDIEGNVYHIKLIGSQVWMTENLESTRYADGSPISPAWDIYNSRSVAYCWYNNDKANKDIYGALYTWTAATRGISGDGIPSRVQGVCPTGWHLPSSRELDLLVDFLGRNVAANKMKEPGSSHWINTPGLPPNASTNESGFTALPGGYRDNYGNFRFLGIFGYWWSSSLIAYSHLNEAMALGISDESIIYENSEKMFGYSVRCLRD